MERRIKKWSRKKKEALIEGNWEKISVLPKKNLIKPFDTLLFEQHSERTGVRN